jgi:hypothetical protein
VLTLEKKSYMAALALAPAMGALAASSRSTARQYTSVDGAADALKESTTPTVGVMSARMRTSITTTAAYMPPPPLSAGLRSVLRYGVATVRFRRQ